MRQIAISLNFLYTSKIIGRVLIYYIKILLAGRANSTIERLD